MTHRDAFLEAILAAPDDDALRLIFADWLDEHGDDIRAEFIRGQVYGTSLLPNDPRQAAWKAREGQLLAAHERAWTAPLRAFVVECQFQRGFVEDVCLDAKSFLKHAPVLFRLAPIRRVQLLLTPELVGELAVCPQLQRIRELDLTIGNVSADALAILFASPHLQGLRELRLRGLNFAMLAALAHVVKRWPGLSTLDLGANMLGNEGLELLLGWPHFSALTTLRLNTNGIGAVGIAQLTQSPLLSQLRGLDLSFNNLGSVGAETLARSPLLGKLESLWLGFNNLGDDGTTALASSPWLTELRHLYLAGDALGGRTVQALARAPGLPQLTCLDLDYNDIPPYALQALAASPYLTGLRTLYLRCARMTPRLKLLLQARFGAHTCRF